MIKNSLIVLWIIFCCAAPAQTSFSWFPVHPNTQYNYKIDTVAGPISAVIKADSVSSQSPFKYYLNKIVTSCDTCHNAQLENDPFDSTYTLNSQPQFLNHSFYKTQASGFYFKGHRSFVLFPFAAVGATWLYDTAQNISALMLTKQAQNILGTNDSTCVIKLSTNDTIVMSKNSGIVKFPYKTVLHRSYQLVGIEGQATAGVKLKRFHDFFDFQAGDVLQYEFADEDYNILPPKLVGGRERWDILATNIYNDSVCCTIRKTYIDSLKYGGSAAVITAYTSTIHLTFVDSLKHPANAYPFQEIMANPYFIYNNGIRHIHKIVVAMDSTLRVAKSFGQVCPDKYLSPGITGPAIETNFANVFLNRNSMKIVGLKLTEGLGITSELYNDYALIYEKCLVGYIKNGHTTGTIYNDEAVGIKINSMKPNFSVYPVPANNQVIINGDLKPGTQISIINAVGAIVLKIIATNDAMQFVNTASLANGLYFIETSNQQFSDTKKLVIQH